MASIYFITGTDTGVGKTVLTALLTRYLRAQGVDVLAVKPFCSGGRDDARALRRAQDNEVTLDEINPWHFRAPLAPLLAARRERRRVAKSEVSRYLRACADRCDLLLIEGAGGLLSPLGEGYDARELMLELKATPIVVCPNRLGAVNQVRLVLSALPPALARQARVGLMQASRPNLATRTNGALLAEYIDAGRLALVPRVTWPEVLEQVRLPVRVAAAFRSWSIRTGNRRSG